MKQPFWKLNLGLLIIACSLLTVMMLYKVKFQRPYQITPVEVPAQALTQKIESLDTSKIYQQNDLFNTYIGPTAQKPTKPDFVQQMPPPPEPVVVTPPEIQAPIFLDPLPITLTGVFMFNDDAKNRAIITNNKSQEETTYKIGDEIEDAQIVKIFANKVLLIRSNGQQEMIYLSQDATTTDATKLTKKDWSSVIKKLDDNAYMVDKQEFINEVATMSNFIEIFNLATAYKHGVSIGIKIGNFEQASLAESFEFSPGDILTKINNLPLTSSSERLVAYKALAQLPENAQFTVEYLRAEQPGTKTITIGTIIQPFMSISKAESPEPKKQKTNAEQEQKLALLKQKEKFAPTLREIRLREKENIIRHQKAVESRKARGRVND